VVANKILFKSFSIPFRCMVIQ